MEFGLIGEHLSHSFSKRIHESVGKYHYEIKELSPNELSSFLMERNFKAINVTIPYKQSVIPYLDELDESATLVGAVNCIVNKDNKLIGYNTDMFGFIYLLEHMSLSVKGKKILLLGNGGASKAVIAALKKLGAKSIVIASILEEEGTIKYCDIPNYKDVEIVINATPVGMYPHNEDKLLFSLDDLPKLEGVVDVVYNPIKTSLIIESQSRGLKAEGGLFMLIAQAYKAIEIFIGQPFTFTEMEKTYKEILLENSNIVLIGMPSCGKSLIANLLINRLNMKVIDTDSEIEKRIKMEIKDYFAKYGEDSFRDIESEVINDIYKTSGNIISTGGGVIKRKENIDKLKQNGIIIFINRDISNLKATDSRPLSNNIDKLKKLYEERLPLYKKYSDIEIDNNKNINEVIDEIYRKVMGI